MSIGVQSYPELYTLLLGWDLYDKFWSLLTDTGIAYIPFIGMILKNAGKAYVMHGNKGAEHALRSMEIQFITTLLLILFGVSPWLALDARAITYSPICSKDHVSFFPGSTGTTYDKAFMIPQGNVRVPLWWYSVIAVSEGLTHSARTLVGCAPDLRKMVTEVSMARIQDPELKQAIQDFETMCYVPAKTQFYQDQKTNQKATLERIQTNIKKYGIEDVEWMGSHGFTETYYRQLRSTRPVSGFPYAANMDMNAESNQSNPPAYGTPSCAEWWTHPVNGLKKKIQQVLSVEFYILLKNEIKNEIKAEKAKDGIIRNTIFNTNGYESANSTISDTSYSNVASSMGVWMHGLVEYPKLYAASQAAPIIQAVILLLMYAFLPFMLIFSGYQARSFVIISIMIFSVIFVSFIWELVTWIDTSLMKALYTDWFSGHSPQATLVDMIISSLIIFAPLGWFCFMGMIGVLAGDSINKMGMGMNQIGSNAAQTGSNQAKNIGASAAKAL